MKQEIYKKLLYYVWCNRSDIDDFEYIKNETAFEEFMKDTDEHFGDCTMDACPCSRCILQTLEIEATRLYIYLFLDEYHKEKYNMEKKWPEIKLP